MQYLGDSNIYVGALVNYLMFFKSFRLSWTTRLWDHSFEKKILYFKSFKERIIFCFVFKKRLKLSAHHIYYMYNYYFFFKNTTLYYTIFLMCQKMILPFSAYSIALICIAFFVCIEYWKKKITLKEKWNNKILALKPKNWLVMIYMNNSLPIFYLIEHLDIIPILSSSNIIIVS